MDAVDEDRRTDAAERAGLPLCHPSITESVIAETGCQETSAPRASAEISTGPTSVTALLDAYRSLGLPPFLPAGSR